MVEPDESTDGAQPAAGATPSAQTLPEAFTATLPEPFTATLAEPVTALGEPFVPAAAPIGQTLPEPHAPTLKDAAAQVGVLPAEGEVTREQPGRYQVKRVFGRGGMSVVYLAHDRHVGRDVALKQLLPRPVEAKKGASHYNARFLREARVTGQLEHPGIVPVYEVGQREDGSQYYTQKLIRGRTLLAAILAAKSLPERLELLKHFVDLCQAMAYAHAMGVVHRDLKPENVMVGAFGETVVLDWGLAKVRGQPDARQGELDAKKMLRDANLGETLDGSVMGTPSYMSPEQARGDLALIDEVSDVFCLGAILFEILTGRPPYLGKDVSALLAKTVSEPVPDVATVQKDAPPELCAIANRALQAERGRRYASAKELAAEVLAWMSGTRVAAYEYSSLELLRKFVQRNRLASAVAAAALVLLIAASGWIARDSRLAAKNLVLARANLAGALLEKAHAAAQAARWSTAAALFAASRTQRDSLEAQWGAAIAEGRAVRPLLVIAPGAGEAWAVRLVQRDGLPAIAAAFEDGTVRLYDARDGAELWKARAHEGAATALAEIPPRAAPARDRTAPQLSAPQGATIASAGSDGAVRFWDLRTGAPRGEGEPGFRASTGGSEVLALAASPDGTLLAAGSLDGYVRLWGAGATAPIAAVKATAQEELGVSAVAFSSDGKLLASAAEDGAARLFQVPTLAVALQIASGVEALDALALSPDGSELATGARDGSIHLYWIDRGAQPDRSTLQPDRSTVQPDRSAPQPAAGGALAAPLSAEARGELKGNDRIIESLAFSPDGARLASASWDSTALIWDPETGQKLARIDGDRRGLTGVAFSSDGERLATSSVDGTVRLFGLPPRPTVLRPGADVRAAVFSPDGEYVATADEGGAVLLWDRKSGALADELDRHDDEVRTLAFSPDGKWLASGDGAGLLRVDDVRTRTPRLILHHEGAVNWAEFSPDGRTLATACEDGAAHLWDVGTGRELFRLAHPERVRGVSFSTDGTRLATACADRRVRIWDPAKGTLLQTLEGHSGKVRVVAWSPDGSMLASAGSDEQILLWSMPRGALAGVLRGHEGLVRTLVFSRRKQEQVLISASADRTVRFWDLPSRTEIATFAERDRELLGAWLSPDGGSLAVAGRDRRVEILPIPDPSAAPAPDDQLALLLARYQLTLTGVSIADAAAHAPAPPRQPTKRKSHRAHQRQPRQPGR